MVKLLLGLIISLGPLCPSYAESQSEKKTYEFCSFEHEGERFGARDCEFTVLDGWSATTCGNSEEYRCTLENVVVNEENKSLCRGVVEVPYIAVSAHTSLPDCITGYPDP